MEKDFEVSLKTGLKTQCQIVSPSSASTTEAEKPKCERVACILAHGLGSNPKYKSHLEGGTSKFVKEGVILSSKGVDVIQYTARGHGNSSGWQETAESDPSQFTWQRLADDMIALADHFGYQNLILGGSSMGSATAFYATINHPERVKALIMAIPPTAWEERAPQRETLFAAADKLLLENGENDKYHFTLLGTAASDFPPLDDHKTYQSIHCPVLILAVKGDTTHPEISAINLQERISHCTLHISENYEKAAMEWPEVAKQFINRLVL
jgi:3-oxoadipate enol-lactonase